VTSAPASVDDYIAGFPPEAQQALASVRAAAHEAIPGAGERISYGMPALTVGGKTVFHFAGWKKHLSIYPIPEGVEGIEPYAQAKGTLVFPWSEPLPLELIGRIAAALSASRTSAASEAEG
jgi:uncharacterized protein YdhG (YjbR/CyaY superfamily)